MEILIIVLQLLLSLSLLVITHEGGHFLFAKLFGIRVEKFYLFFDPWFSLFKIKRGETEYGIGWVPLGGYVKISGMIDESMDTDQMKQPMQPWEFRAKPAWQRLLVMVGGVLVNIITAPIIFWLMLYSYGETYVPISEARYGMEFSDAMHNVGFVDGDKIIGINGEAKDTYKDVANAIIFDDTCSVDIEREGQPMSIKLPHEFFRQILSGEDQALFSFLTPVVVDSVMAGSPAKAAGMLRGDSILSLGGETVRSFRCFVALADSMRGETSQLVVVRATGSTDTLSVNIDAEGRLGFYGCNAQRWFQSKTREYGLFEAFPAGIAKGYDLLVNYCKQLPMLFTREGATKVGGFGTIANMFAPTWNWQSFWFNTAFLAIILAVMNILPIPALDGGHVLFLLIEVITGRKVSDRVLEVAQTIGMILLFALIIYANGADIVRAILK